MGTRMTGAQAFMEVLVSEGVEYVFGNPGSTEFGILDAISSSTQVKYIMGLQENIPLGMADGYARACGKTGVVNVHTTMGGSNTMLGLYNAYRGGTSLVVTMGQIPSEAIMRDGMLSGDMVELSKPLTKWGAEIHRTADIPMVMRRAFKVAAQPPTGPVFLSFPCDLMDNSEEMEVPPVSHVYSASRPDSEALTRTASLLANSENPVIYVGDRVAHSHAVAEAVELAETLGAKVYAARWSEMNFPTNHPLFMGINAFGDDRTARVLAGADVVLIVGANLGLHLFQHNEPAFPAGIKVIHLDSNPWEIAKNYPVEIGMIAGCKAGLRDIIDSLQDSMSSAQRRAASSRAKAIEQAIAKRRESIEKRARESWDSVPLSLPRFVKEIQETIKPGTVIATEAFTAWPDMRRYLDSTEPGTFFALAAGALGWGMPGALGVQLALPERPVVALMGEGAGMYSIQALWTAAHYNIPVTYVIINNASYDTLRVNWIATRGKEPGPDWLRNYVALEKPNLDYVKIAEASGIRGWRVEKPAELAPALKEALQSRKPAVLDVATMPAS